MPLRAKIASFRLPDLGTTIPVLDGLRGVAVLMVMAHHFTLYGGFEPSAFIDFQIKRLADSGWLGVDLFFVLSGFLITGILVETRGGQKYFQNFYARRFVRIFPLYYLVLAVSILVVPALASTGPKFLTFIEEQFWYWSYLLNVSVALDGWPEFNALAHFWTLAVEEQYYLVWPLIVFIVPPKHLQWVCVALVVGAIATRLTLVEFDMRLAAYVLTPARVDTLAIGGLLAIMMRREAGRRILSVVAAPLTVVSAVLIAGTFIYYRYLPTDELGILTYGFTTLAVFFAGVLLLTITADDSNLLARMLGGKTLRMFGRYSYALYVFHHIIAIYLPRYFSVNDVPSFMGSVVPGLIAFSLVATVLSLGLALLSWHLVELPFLGLKKYVAYSTRSVPARGPAPSVAASSVVTDGAFRDTADAREL